VPALGVRRPVAADGSMEPAGGQLSRRAPSRLDVGDGAWPAPYGTQRNIIFYAETGAHGVPVTQRAVHLHR
jgi:hypothetical protein